MGIMYVKKNSLSLYNCHLIVQVDLLRWFLMLYEIFLPLKMDKIEGTFFTLRCLILLFQFCYTLFPLCKASETVCQKPQKSYLR